MKKRNSNIVLFSLVLLSAIGSFTSCSNKEWDEHYSIDKSIVSDKTLWQVLKSDTSLSKFAWVVKATGYSEVFNRSQMYTIWAPSNQNLADVDTTKKLSPQDSILYKKTIVENHMTRAAHSASGIIRDTIALTNKKVAPFNNMGDKFYFGSNEIVKKNVLAKNGLVHVINGRVPFFSNIWESLLDKSLAVDSLRDYLYSFNRSTFIPEMSLAGGVNSKGETVYLDSVIILDNAMFKKVARMNAEDSAYNVVFPTNAAWTASYNNIKDYFKYYYSTDPKKTPSKYTADTLQRNNARYALVKDLVFTKRNQNFDKDSVISTTKSVFHTPKSLIQGATVREASNGTIHVMDALNYQPWESWNKAIRVEAEKSSGRKYNWATLYDRNYVGTEFNKMVSGDKYIELVPPNATTNPYIIFDIPNTLSGKQNADKSYVGARYNIYCVFMPAKLATDAKANKVVFQLTKMDDAGTPKTYDFKNSDGKGFVTDPNKMTKVLVASDVVFPYSEYGFTTTPTVTLKVSSLVSPKETVTYTNVVCIDCIILEPVH